jgi:hypothetical protein
MILNIVIIYSLWPFYPSVQLKFCDACLVLPEVRMQVVGIAGEHHRRSFASTSIPLAQTIKYEMDVSIFVQPLQLHRGKMGKIQA